jgi:hypothetical protein
MIVCCTAKRASSRTSTATAAPTDAAGVPSSMPLGTTQFPTKPIR